MTYVFESNGSRFVDHQTGHELTVLSGGSDGSALFKLIGPDGAYEFRAEKVFPQLTTIERTTMGISAGEEATVWRVVYATPQFEQQIKRALLAFKSGNGFHYSKSVYFVQFGMTGNLHDA